MIEQVMRVSTAVANMMAVSAFALALTIATAGIVERSNARCYACLDAKPIVLEGTGMKLAFTPPRTTL